MHTRSAYTPRTLFGTAATGPLMLRGPAVTWAPEDDDGAPEPSAVDQERAAVAALNGGDPDPEPAGDPEPEPAAAGGEDDPEPEPKADDKKPKDGWAHRRIDRLSREKADAQRELEEARAEAARLRAIVEGAGGSDDATGSDPTPPPPKALSETDIDRRARELVAQKEFTDKCNAVAEAGKKLEGWSEGIANLGRMGVLTETGGPVLNAALETDAPEIVLHHLGSNPDEAERIAALSPAKMAIEMDRLATKLRAPKAPAISRVPAPMTPVDGARAGNPIDIYDPNLSDEDFFAAREKQTRGMAPGQR